jgi:hypothetical protein
MRLCIAKLRCKLFLQKELDALDELPMVAMIRAADRFTSTKKGCHHGQEKDHRQAQ